MAYEFGSRDNAESIRYIAGSDGLGVSDSPATAGAGDTFTHSGLTNGTAYRYSLFAVDSAGNVSAAAQAEGIPVDNVPPAAVQNLRRTDTYSGP